MIASGIKTSNIARLYTEQPKVPKASAVKTSGGMAVGRDEFVPSPQLQDFGHWLQQLKDMPEVRENKVTALVSAVDNGTYRISTEALAVKMLERLQQK